MTQKPIMSCMAVAAFAAFVLPSVASAANSPDLTEGATRVAVGANTIGTLTGTADFMNTTGSGDPLASCSKAVLTGTITNNSAGSIEGTITTADFWGSGPVVAHNSAPECTGNIGNSWLTVVNTPLTLKSTPAIAEHSFQLTGSAGTKIRFIIGSTLIGECEYEATGSAITGKYTTGATTVLAIDNTQSGSGSTKIRGPIFCPVSGQLRMSFFLETENGTELGIS